MRKWIGMCALWLVALLVSCQGLEASSIEWYQDYSKAVAVAREQGKPMVLLFTGSDWCGWCIRLKEDILNTPEFEKAVQDQFVFVELDFPAKTKLPEEIASQNRELRQHFKIHAYPTVIVTDADGNRLGQGNFSGSETPAQFAQQLRNAAKDAKGFSAAISQLDTLELSIGELKALYSQARAMDRTDDIARLLEVGMAREEGSYFLSEKYRQLVEEGRVASEEGQEVRAELLARDRHNEEGSIRMVALLDFQQLASDPTLPVERVTEPLLSYLNRYGSEDSSGRWGIHMILAQFLASRGEVASAKEHAKASLTEAPEEIRGEIGSFLDGIGPI